MKACAIIPARGGSKRIPRKNIRVFAGQPIIAYSIATARDSGLFDRIIVTTDDAEIAKVARTYGADVPFVRSEKLADDHATTDAVLLDALGWLEDHSQLPEYFCCIYATAPFVTADHLRQGFELLRQHQVTTVFPVATFPASIFRALRLNKGGRIEPLWPENALKRSQDFPEVYYDVGQFYWGDTAKYLFEKRLYAMDSMPLLLPRYLAQDIDTPEDWDNAERMYLALNLHTIEEGM